MELFMNRFSSEELAKKVFDILDSHKAIDIETINIEKKSSLADRFVICSGSSQTQVKSLADHVQYELEKEGILARSAEGYESSRWILLDYVDVIVHIFHPEERKFYSLAKLWKARPQESEIQISEEMKEDDVDKVLLNMSESIDEDEADYDFIDEFEEEFEDEFEDEFNEDFSSNFDDEIEEI